MGGHIASVRSTDFSILGVVEASSLDRSAIRAMQPETRVALSGHPQPGYRFDGVDFAAEITESPEKVSAEMQFALFTGH